MQISTHEPFKGLENKNCLAHMYINFSQASYIAQIAHQHQIEHKPYSSSQITMDKSKTWIYNIYIYIYIYTYTEHKIEA